MLTKYFGEWKTREDVAKDFAVDLATFPGEDDILFATYGTPSYEGYAVVLYRDGDKLMEVQAGHCSCYGLEDQWHPDEVSVEQLHARPGLNRYEEHDAAAYPAWDALIASLSAPKGGA